jgi:hypothetical protein
MISVVQPAYQALPNGGHGSFLESGNRRLSCVRVFATFFSQIEDRGAERGDDTLGWICDSWVTGQPSKFLTAPGHCRRTDLNSSGTGACDYGSKGAGLGF